MNSQRFGDLQIIVVKQDPNLAALAIQNRQAPDIGFGPGVMEKPKSYDRENAESLRSIAVSLNVMAGCQAVKLVGDYAGDEVVAEQATQCGADLDAVLVGPLDAVEE